MNVKSILLRTASGAITGALSAMVVDFRIFSGWKNVFYEGAKYDWKVAASRWLQGAVSGAAAANGAGWLLGA